MNGLLNVIFLLPVVSQSNALATKSSDGQTRTTWPTLPFDDSMAVYASEGTVQYTAHTKKVTKTGTRAGFEDNANQVADKEHVELFRFVTAYAAGMEAIMDMTPYAPLIKAAVAANNLTIYNFLDTWVNNNTASSIVYMNNVTGKCMLRHKSEGNGWSLSAHLLFWKDARTQVSTEPRELVTLSSGWYGGTYPIGRIGYHNANITEGGTALLLEKSVDFSTIKTAAVYDLAKQELGIASLMGYVAERTELLTRAGNSAEVDALYQDTLNMLMFSALAKMKVSEVDHTKGQVHGKYNGSNVQWEPDMPVYFNSYDIYTDQNMGNGWWLNETMPLKPVGHILIADGENVTIKLDGVARHCLPSNLTQMLPSLLIPVRPHSVANLNATLQKVRDAGTAAAAPSPAPGDFTVLAAGDDGSKTNSGVPGERLQLLTPTWANKDANETRLVSPTLLGQVDVVAASSGGSTENSWKRLMLTTAIDGKLNMTDGTTVGVITQEHHGRLVHRDFSLPNLVYGDKVILQLVVTGHGWASTLEQCGEYCHAVYRLTLNGKSAFNVTQFRDDCKHNPINASFQRGTWDESRNGWCPGTVAPGLFMDMTHHLQKGANNINIDLVVWSNTTLSYEPYTDYSGFVYNDLAKMAVGMTAFVYNESAVEAILGQDQAYTAAEAAIKEGCSAPLRLQPPAFVNESPYQVLLEQDAETRPGGYTMKKRGGAFTRFTDPEDPEVASSLLEASAHESSQPRMVRAEIKAGGQAQRQRAADNHDDVRHKVRHHHHGKAHSAERFHFENRAPWYLYNEQTEGAPQVHKRVTLFENELIQGNSRDVAVKVDPTHLPADWSRVAVHFQLEKPEDSHLEIDHWDRVGSFGLRLN